MLQKSYDRIVAFANHPHAVWVLALVSFVESSISPIPPIPLLIPMCLANPARAWTYATVCALASIAGGYVGYLIGFGLYETVGLWIIHTYGLEQQASKLLHESSHYWFWILLTKGLTPIPFKIATIMSGLLKFDIVLFTVGTVVARFTFFFMFAAALRVYGDHIREFIERRLKLSAIVMLAFLVGGFVLIRYV